MVIPQTAHTCTVSATNNIRELDAPPVAKHEDITPIIRIEFPRDWYPVAHIPRIGMKDDHRRSRFDKLPS